MKGKLRKDKDGNFHLSHDPSGWWIADSDHEKVEQHKGEQTLHKLSKQNCDEIFGIVDIDTMMCNIESNCNKTKEGFVLGFKMAMELNKDKKFTEVDMIKFADAVYKLRKENQVFEGMPELLQSLQQPKQIEVEVVMDKIPADLAPGGWDVFPRLDKEGCIILKRVV